MREAASVNATLADMTKYWTQFKGLECSKSQKYKNIFVKLQGWFSQPPLRNYFLNFQSKQT